MQVPRPWIIKPLILADFIGGKQRAFSSDINRISLWTPMWTSWGDRHWVCSGVSSKESVSLPPQRLDLTMFFICHQWHTLYRQTLCSEPTCFSYTFFPSFLHFFLLPPFLSLFPLLSSRSSPSLLSSCGPQNWSQDFTHIRQTLVCTSSLVLQASTTKSS